MKQMSPYLVCSGCASYGFIRSITIYIPPGFTTKQCQLLLQIEYMLGLDKFLENQSKNGITNLTWIEPKTYVLLNVERRTKLQAK